MKKTLAIIGAGNMGAALCRGLMHGLPSLSLSIADTHEEHLKEFSAIKTSTDAAEIATGSDVILIAVKPQSFDALRAEPQDLLRGKLVISIMAGKTLNTLMEKTGSARVVRAMPNLGVKVGHGMTAWIAAPSVTEGDAAFVQEIFQSVGKDIRVETENLIDSFTAIVGCGPAYYFHLCDLLMNEAASMGFSAEDARAMAEETLIASAKLLENEGKTAQEWVNAVASKGGATEAALKHLQQSGADDAWSQAVQKALQRAREL